MSEPGYLNVNGTNVISTGHLDISRLDSGKLNASIDLSGAQDAIAFDGVTYAMAEVEVILRAHEEGKARGL